MEYFIGSITTLVLVILVGIVYRKYTYESEVGYVSYSQAYIYSLIAPYLQDEIMVTIPAETQASRFNEAQYVRIVVLDSNAYWIRENTFYMADMGGEEVLKDTTRAVDIMAMDKVQLDKMVYIIEKLTEGKNNDRRDSGQS